MDFLPRPQANFWKSQKNHFSLFFSSFKYTALVFNPRFWRSFEILCQSVVLYNPVYSVWKPLYWIKNQPLPFTNSNARPQLPQMKLKEIPIPTYAPYAGDDRYSNFHTIFQFLRPRFFRPRSTLLRRVTPGVCYSPLTMPSSPRIIYPRTVYSFCQPRSTFA